MNWLNAIDHVLENGFVRGENDGSEEYTQSTGTGLDESATWSDDDDDEDESSHHVQLAFMAGNNNSNNNNSSSAIEEESERDVEVEAAVAAAGEDDNTNELSRTQRPTAKPPQRTARQPLPGQPRPGTVRRLTRQVSTSSEEESSDGESSDTEDQKANTSLSKTQKNPAPISLSGQNSLLKKQKLNQGGKNPAPSKKSVVLSRPSYIPGRPRQSPRKTSAPVAPPPPAPTRPQQAPPIPEPELNPIMRADTIKVDNTAKPKLQQDRQVVQAKSPMKQEPVTRQRLPKPPPQPASVVNYSKQTNTTEAAAHQQQQRIKPPSKPRIATEEATPIKNNRQFGRNNKSDTTAAKAPDQMANTKTTKEAKISTSNNPSVASSNWSWTGSAAKSMDELSDHDNMMGQGDDNKQQRHSQTIIETSFLNEEKQKEPLDATRKSAPDDFADEDVTSLTNELEELRALVDAVSAENGAKHAPESGIVNKPRQVNGKDHALNDASAQEIPQSTDSITLEKPVSKNVLKKESTAEEFYDAPLLDSNIDTNAAEVKAACRTSNISVPPGEHKSNSEGNPSRVPQSEATLRIANVTASSPSNSSPSSQGSLNHASDASLDINGVMDSKKSQDSEVERQSPGLSIKHSSSELRRKSSLFEVDGVSSSWTEDPATSALAPYNCYGAFHIRLLRAQRLPCPVGSTVQAIVSLDPWKGRSRTERRTTFVLDEDPSSFDHGVCALWDDEEDDSASIVSLVHAYASEATPIPTIKIQLMLSPMKMLEFSMCSLTLPCAALMRCPGKRTRQWFLAEMQDAKTSHDSQLFGGDQTAMVEAEAVFVPDDQALGSSFLSIGQLHQADDEEDETDSQEAAPNEFSSSLVHPKLENGPSEVASVKPDNDGNIPSKKPHLLRVKRFWKPATCAQCSASLLGWRKTSFRCEACGLDCCSDCRLHLDVQIPCGSERAIEIVGKAIQSKLTISKFLEAMAPVDERFEQKKREFDTGTVDGSLSLADTRTETGTTQRGDKTRIGVLKLSVARACVFSDPMPAVSEPAEVQNRKGELRPGDYYVRVCRTGTEGSSRTRTIPSGGQLKFEDSSDMRLDVSYYGVEFFIEVVDALTDKPVGTSVLTTHGLLQQQRDLMLEQGRVSILNVGKKPPSFKGKRRVVLELRTGVKSGVSSGFFVPSDAKADQGEISGWVEINVALEEDVKRLYGPTPCECPAPPPDSLNLRTLNLHIERISDIVEDIINLFRSYLYLVSWKNPLLTGFSFLVFLAFTIRFNAEYVGCLPFLFLMVWMLSSAFARSNGNTKKRFVQEEADEWRAAEREIGVNYSLHRPVGRINIAITKGRNIRSRELGLAGNVGCRVYWDPLRYASRTQKEKILAIDKSAKTLHEIGSTDSKFTTSPSWENFNQSDECRRLKQVLPHQGHFFETEEEISQVSGCEFPVLQPFRKVEDDDVEETTQHFNAILERWEASTGAVVFQIRFRDFLNMLPGSDHVFGEVVLPLSALLEKGEMSGWYQVLDVGTTMFAPVKENATLGMPGLIEEASVVSGKGDVALPTASDIPKVWLAVKWIPPEESLGSIEARETDREASAIIQEELLRWEVINRDKDKLKQLVVGGSIGAFQTVSGFAGTLQVIQNFLGKLASTVEAIRNLLNFTDPYKSSMVLAAVTLLWLVLSLVPTRLIILVAGLAQYGVTAKNRIEKLLKADHTKADDDASQASDLDEDEGEDAPIIWLKNAFRGLPTDEDLRRTYFWEGRRNGAKTRETYATEKRLARLKRLWRAQWHASVKVRGDSDSKGVWAWDKIFAVVQGRRFLWWRTVEDFDNGRPPLGRVFLAGHAGLSGLSPLETREINPKDVPFVVGIFGRGLQDQQRVTLLLPSAELKESIENAVIGASIKAD